MNKKTLYVTFLITSLLAISMVYKPHINKVSAAEVDLLRYDRICPVGDVYQDDIYQFGGTLYNNDTSNTYRISSLRVDIYNISSQAIPQTTIATDDFDAEDPRYWLEPFESRSVYFEYAINLTIGSSYNLTVNIQYFDIESQTEFPNDIQIGENATINVIYKRPPSPAYIWVVLVLLTMGILAMVIVGIVGWVRDRRAKK